MTVSSKVNKQTSRYKPNPVGQKHDFFEWDYLVNSPQDMITGFREMPFVEHDDRSRFIKASTPFLDITTYYRELENNLFMICSEAEYKANICFKHRYDKDKPAEFYCLSLRVHSYSKTINSLVNGIGYSANSWLIFKPGAKVNHHHFKGTKGRYISLYFTQSWLDNYLLQNEDVSNIVKAFINAESEFLICPYLQENSLLNTDPLYDLLVNCNAHEPEHIERVTEQLNILFRFFKSKILEEQINERHFNISNQERMKVLVAEQILKAHTFSKFPGITFLAKETGLSETKLKECFRIVYGKTLSRYLHELQMQAARELILNTDLHIGQVAQKFRYENTSKFSAAFRKYHSMLPSEIKHSRG